MTRKRRKNKWFPGAKSNTSAPEADIPVLEDIVLADDPEEMKQAAQRQQAQEQEASPVRKSQASTPAPLESESVEIDIIKLASLSEGLANGIQKIVHDELEAILVEKVQKSVSEALYTQQNQIKEMLIDHMMDQLPAILKALKQSKSNQS